MMRPPCAQAMAGVFEIDEAELGDAQQALKLREIAITLEGSGGFNMSGKGKDFEATLSSYMKAALQGKQTFGYTL